MDNDIPCYMPVNEVVRWVREMIPHVIRLGLRPVILDHGTTFPPSLDWLASAPCEVRRYENHGCYGYFNRMDCTREPGLFVHSDSDLDLSGVPSDAVDKLRAALDRHPWATKAGLSLEVDDIPDSVPCAREVKGWESGHWQDRLDDGNWRAGIGGTFALYSNLRPVRVNQNGSDFYRAVRLDRPYTARHFPWYLTPEDVRRQDDLRYYFEKVGRLSHWSAKIGAYSGVRPPLE